MLTPSRLSLPFGGGARDPPWPLPTAQPFHPLAPVGGRVLLVAYLLALAGCSGAPLHGGENEERVPDTPTATPAPVPDLTPTPTRTPPPVTGPTVTAEGDLALGVTTGGVVDAISLGTAHRDALDGRNLTVQRVVRVKYPNGTVVRLEETVALSADRRRLHLTTATDDRRFGRWWLNYSLARTERNGTVTHSGRVRSERTHALESIYRRSFPSLLVATDEARVTRVGEEGPPEADDRLTTTTDTLREAGSPFSLDPDPGVVSLYVRADGLVVGWDLAYTARTRGGTPVAVRTELRHVDIGTTSVERPAWYDEALAATGVNATATPSR